MAEASANAPTDRDLWDRIGELRWQHVVLAVAALACVTALLVASFYAPPALSLHIGSDPTTTTTEVR